MGYSLERLCEIEKEIILEISIIKADKVKRSVCSVHLLDLSSNLDDIRKAIICLNKYK